MTGPQQMWLATRRAMPLVLGTLPFGLVAGATAASVGLDWFAASAMSVIVFAGAAQLSALELMRADAPALVIVAAAVVINLRMVMYSAALAPRFRGVPGPMRALCAYILTDQSFALSALRFEEPEGTSHPVWFYLGASLPLWICWQITTVIGVVVGARVPPELSLEFAVPLIFIAMAIPAIRSRHGLVACGVSVGVVVLASSVPYGLGLILAAIAGVAAGAASERRAS